MTPQPAPPPRPPILFTTPPWPAFGPLAPAPDAGADARLLLAAARPYQARSANPPGTLYLAEADGGDAAAALADAAHQLEAEFALDARDGSDAALVQVHAGLDAGGRLLAWQYRHAGPVSASREPETLGPEGDAAACAGAVALPYRLGARRCEFVSTRGRRSGCGTAFNTFCVESAVDELAAMAGQDPLAFRRAHLDDERWQQTLATVAGASGWHTPTPPGGARGLAIGCSFHSVVAQVVELRRGDDGKPRVERVTVAVDSYLPLSLQHSQAPLRRGVEQALLRLLGPRAQLPAFDMALVAPPRDGQRTLVPEGVAGLALPTLAPALANALCALGWQRWRRLATPTAGLALAA